MAITANVTNGKLDKTNTTPTQNRKTSSAKASGSNLGYDDFKAFKCRDAVPGSA